MSTAPATAAATTTLPAINLTEYDPPPADARVTIVSQAGVTLTAIIVPADWCDPPLPARHQEGPLDDAGRELETQLRALGITSFQFRDFPPGDPYATQRR